MANLINKYTNLMNEIKEKIDGWFIAESGDFFPKDCETFDMDTAINSYKIYKEILSDLKAIK